MRPLPTATLLVTFALNAWARTSLVPAGTRNHDGHKSHKGPVISLDEDGTPVLRYEPNRILGRDAEPDLSGFPADFNDLPVKTEINLEGENITIWALKFDHVDAVIPTLKEFLCGNPEYAPLFPTLCAMQESLETQSHSLKHPDPTTRGSEKYTMGRYSQTPGQREKPSVSHGDRTASAPDGVKFTRHKVDTFTASPSKRLSTVFIPKGKSYRASTIEIDEERSPLGPARTRSGGKSHLQTTQRGGGFSRLTRSRAPKATDHRSMTKISGPKSSGAGIDDGRSTESTGFHLTRSRQPRPSSHTKNLLPSPIKSSMPTSSNRRPGQITIGRSSPSNSVHSTAFSNSKSGSFDRSTTSKPQQHTTTGIDKQPTSRPALPSANLTDDNELHTTQVRSRTSPSSFPGHPTRPTPTRLKADVHTRSIHRTVPISANSTSPISTQRDSADTISTTVPRKEATLPKSSHSGAWPPKKATSQSQKPGASHSTSAKDESRSKIKTLPIASSENLFSQVDKTTMFQSTATNSAAGASKTSSRSLWRS